MSESEIAQAMASIAPPHVRVAARAITVGDEDALTMEERATSPTPMRRESGSARIAARSLLDDARASIPRSISGAPRWPRGFVGSLAHDDVVAVAAVARSVDVANVGVDVEPRAPLCRDLVPIVLTPNERRWIAGDLVLARLVFCAKEAVFKALHPLDGRWLDLHDVDIDPSFRALVRGARGGKALEVRVAHAPRLAALTVVPIADRPEFSVQNAMRRHTAKFVAKDDRSSNA